jgi:multiple sugar transport system substrate-binding protein
MRTHDKSQTSISRREFLSTTAAATGGLAASGMLPDWALAQTEPWSVRPSTEVDEVNFVVWSYGRIYEEIAAKFEADWGVPVNPTISPYPEHETKFSTMIAGGELVDVGVSQPGFMASLIQQGLVEPIDDMPGAQAYIDDFTPSFKQAVTYDGKHYGLPYFSAVFVWEYYEDLMDKAGIDHPFESYEELVDQCLKVKRDGHAEYPILWPATTSGPSVEGTFFANVWNRGGVIFDAQGDHQLGPGSIARETLQWLADTFHKYEISDPEGINLSFGQASTSFGAGLNLYMGPIHHYGLHQVNLEGKTPISGRVRVHTWPNDGETLGTSVPYYMTVANRDKEWAWKLLQYLGGRTKDGEYTQALGLMRNAMLGSGYQSLMESDEIAMAWGKWGDVDKILETWNKSSFTTSAVSVYLEPWYQAWFDLMAIEFQKVLTGDEDVDRACDNMIRAIETAKRSI